MATCNYGCAQLADHQQVECGDHRLGGFSAVALLDCDHGITDFTNATQWQDEIDAGRAHLILSIKGEIPAASPSQQDNPVGCGAAQIVSGFDNTALWNDFNTNANNDDLYAKLNGGKYYVVMFNCEEDEILVSKELATFTAVPRMVPMDNRSMQMYSVTAAFYTKVKEIPFAQYAAPSGIFTN